MPCWQFQACYWLKQARSRSKDHDPLPEEPPRDWLMITWSYHVQPSKRWHQFYHLKPPGECVGKELRRLKIAKFWSWFHGRGWNIRVVSICFHPITISQLHLKCHNSFSFNESTEMTKKLIILMKNNVGVIVKLSDRQNWLRITECSI